MSKKSLISQETRFRLAQDKFLNGENPHVRISTTIDPKRMAYVERVAAQRGIAFSRAANDIIGEILTSKAIAQKFRGPRNVVISRERQRKTIYFAKEIWSRVDAAVAARKHRGETQYQSFNVVNEAFASHEKPHDI